MVCNIPLHIHTAACNAYCTSMTGQPPTRMHGSVLYQCVRRLLFTIRSRACGMYLMVTNSLLNVLK